MDPHTGLLLSYLDQTTKLVRIREVALEEGSLQGVLKYIRDKQSRGGQGMLQNSLATALQVIGLKKCLQHWHIMRILIYILSKYMAFLRGLPSAMSSSSVTCVGSSKTPHLSRK